MPPGHFLWILQVAFRKATCLGYRQGSFLCSILFAGLTIADPKHDSICMKIIILMKLDCWGLKKKSLHRSLHPIHGRSIVSTDSHHFQNPSAMYTALPTYEMLTHAIPPCPATEGEERQAKRADDLSRSMCTVYSVADVLQVVPPES